MWPVNSGEKSGAMGSLQGGTPCGTGVEERVMFLTATPLNSPQTTEFILPRASQTGLSRVLLLPANDTEANKDVNPARSLDLGLVNG